MEQNEKLQEILDELRGLKSSLKQASRPNISDDWISRKEAMEFFNYGDTQITELEKNPIIVSSKVGKRIFFSKKSIVHLIESNIKS